MNWRKLEVSIMAQEKENMSKEYLNIPKLNSKTRVSQDGKWLVNTTTITSFTSMNYIETVMNNRAEKAKLEAAKKEP